MHVHHRSDGKAPVTNVAALRESNAERAQRLAQQGLMLPHLFDVGMAVKFRLDVLTDYLCSHAVDATVVDRDEFELHYERAVEETLVEAEKHANRARLLAPHTAAQLRMALSEEANKEG